MHIAAAVLYGLTIWCAMLLFSALSGEHFWLVFLCAPIIVSGSAVFVIGLDYLIWRFMEQHEETREPAE